jgi:hypothetical protein
MVQITKLRLWKPKQCPKNWVLTLTGSINSANMVFFLTEYVGLMSIN